MILLFDNYDSFTYNLFDLLKQLNVEIKVVRNDELTLQEIISLNPQAILISPGPGRPEEAGILMELIAYFYDKLPMLGVCLGHQALAIHFGAKLLRASKPMHGKTSIVFHHQHQMFKGLSNESPMMRYHSLIIQNIPKELIVTAYTQENEIMAIAHVNLPLWGVQFHPESVLSNEGPQLIKNWITHFQLIKDFQAFC